MDSCVLTVSQVNSYVKDIFAEDAILSDISIMGELSGLKRHTSGHMYFTLKDEQCAVSAAMFKWQRQQLRFIPENGMKVIARGKITLYEPTGQYQLVVSSMQPSGIGELYAAYERLKQNLEDEGLFDDSCKRPIPQFPERVGVVTSKTGAALQDILNITGRRYPQAEIVLCPVMVQGEQAPAQIAAAIALLDKKQACDVMIVGRGGGSIEDLWAFNDERVARAVAASTIPVISAVGHETDFTICDYVADLRAPTPSAAAELAVPNQNVLKEAVDDMAYTMAQRVNALLERYTVRLSSAVNRQCFSSPMYSLELRAQRADMAFSRINGAVTNVLGDAQAKLSVCAARMAALNPFAVLSRGYSMTFKGEALAGNAADLNVNDEIEVRFCDGSAKCTVNEIKAGK